MKLVIGLLLLTLSCQASWFTRHKVINSLNMYACAVSIMDAGTTYSAEKLGAHEVNPLFIKSGQAGLANNVNWPVLIGAKALVCGVPFILTNIAHKTTSSEAIADNVSLAISGAAASSFTYVSISNFRVIRAQEAINQAIAKGK